jgi:hypothetical protein
MNVWNYMFWLRGKTLHTLGTRRPFIVKSVDAVSLVIVPRSSGKERTITRSEIEGAFNELWVAHELTLTSVGEIHSETNPSYIVALLAQLPNVAFEVKPIRLIWTK